MNNYKIFEQNSIKINDDIYIDPFHVDDSYNDAKLILITHTHYDHFSIEDINKVSTPDTVFACPKDAVDILKENGYTNVYEVSPNNTYTLAGYNISTVPAYNVIKPFHPKSKKWVGYIINVNNENIYICGDTDLVSEIKDIKCNTLFVPIGGKFTMNVDEAIKLTNLINPQNAYPTHFGTIVGSKDLYNDFKNGINSNINTHNYL